MVFGQPGMSYEDMFELVYSAKPVAAGMFSNELLIGIFWEESLFNNIEQQGGTAWGFGQVEPAEMYRCENDEAKSGGYYVPGLPPRMKVGKATRLAGKLTPEQSVQVAAGVLVSTYYARNCSVEGALKGYAGVNYSGTDVPEALATAAAREAIIAGWRECEKHLQGPQMEKDFPTFVKTGLRKARKFDMNDRNIDDVLFPKNYVTEAGERIWRPQRTPRWLTAALGS